MRVNTKSLNCGSCGAPVNLNEEKCDYCGNRIELLLCGLCGSTSSKKNINCVVCGASLLNRRSGESKLDCPRCLIPMETIDLNTLQVDKCQKCHGLFISHHYLQQFIKEQALEAVGKSVYDLKKFDLVPDPSPYLKCPECHEWMARQNYTSKSKKRSGILVDICRDHGIWFDKGEFSSLGEFLRSGGVF